MAKLVTPEMLRIEKKRHKKSGAVRKSSPGRDAWKRLKRNRTAVVGMCIVIILALVAIFAPIIAPYDYAEQDYSALSETPSGDHWFGTDHMGRDIFSRCVYGARYSLPIGLLCVVFGMLVGGIVGVTSSYFGGRLDNILMRLMDILQSIPGTLLTIAIVAALGNGVDRLVLAVTISFMPASAKVCRAAIFTVKSNEYIESSRAVGAGGVRLMLRHMIPNAVGPIIIFAVSMMSSSILVVSSLSYLGLGIAPPLPEWGALLSSGKDFIRSSPHMVIFPGAMIMITVFAFNLFGDGLRDALDPRLK